MAGKLAQTHGKNKAGGLDLRRMAAMIRATSAFQPDRQEMAAPQPPETIEVDKTQVSCDGGGALGHPRVWLNLGKDKAVDCPYCDRRFVLKAGAHAAAH